SAVATAARLIRAAGRKLLADAATAGSARMKIPVCPDAATLAKQVDLLLVFGGDGTMLRVAREIAGSRTPMRGVHIGGLGFPTAVSSQHLGRALKQIWSGQFKFESRPLIEATTRRNRRSIPE